jgi:AcrR family transcriptional regulator
VTDSQRRRIRAAVVEVVSARGFPEARVVDVIEVAGVSRKTFDEHFVKQHLGSARALFSALLRVHVDTQ